MDRFLRIPRGLKEPASFVRSLRAPIQSYIHTEEVGAVILLLAAATALGWANSPWSESYADFWHTHLSFDIHIFAISEDLGHLVNDGLMAVFFFIVGLEIKRELLHGELSSFRKAIVPVAAAIGGMAAPALIYVAFNGTGEGSAGWGIPMATDIAFALGILALLGKRIPVELRVFLLGLAVVDDLGAIAVIAIFYSDAISWVDLGLAVAIFGVIAACVRFGVGSFGFYLVLSVVMWQFLLESGIHATLAGVALAAIVPSKPTLPRKNYEATVDGLLQDFRLAMENGDEEEAQTIVEEIERLSRGTEGPMERIEGVVHPWVSFLILPLFALANAGIVFTSDTLSEASESPVTLGILVALTVRQGCRRAGRDVAGRAAGHRQSPHRGQLGAGARRGDAGRHRVHRRHLRRRDCLRRPGPRRPGKDRRVCRLAAGRHRGLPVPAIRRDPSPHLELARSAPRSP